jgi:hypothetical protein
MKIGKVIISILLIFSSVIVTAQSKFSTGLKENCKSLKYNTGCILFLSIDSILDERKKILRNIKNEFSEPSTFYGSKNYYLFKIGYYVSDSNYLNDSHTVFEELKNCIKKNRNKKIVKIDANCQDYLNVPLEAHKYEDIIGNKLENSIYIFIYKSKSKIVKHGQRKQCYF